MEKRTEGVEDVVLELVFVVVEVLEVALVVAVVAVVLVCVTVVLMEDGPTGLVIGGLFIVGVTALVSEVAFACVVGVAVGFASAGAAGAAQWY